MLSKAEAAGQSASSTTGKLSVGWDLLQPCLQAARRQLEVERACEALSRAAASAKAVSDLPRLEAAILAARKVGAHEADTDAYRLSCSRSAAHTHKSPADTCL